jgi:GTPase
LPSGKLSAGVQEAGRRELPLVAIVGRPNVGKSTLFNRLTRSRRSIVGDEPGITRDRIYGEYEWAGRSFRLVDTGGMVPGDEALLPAQIQKQAQVALAEADAAVLVVDVRTELARPDYDLARLLTRSAKRVFLAVNKVETEALAAQAENFRKLGIADVFAVSAEHGLGIGELLDAISAAVPERERVSESASQRVSVPHPSDKNKDVARVGHPAFPVTAEIEPRPSKARVGHPMIDEGEKGEKGKIRTHGEYEQRETSIAIIGRPNVGKSTLLNALTGTTRAIVSPEAGTTRDAVDEVVEFEGATLRFVDTAGIRRKGKTRLMAEKLSVVMARKHLEAADVALLVIDATEGVTASDATIGGYAHESGRSVIVIVNKWDAVTHPNNEDLSLGAPRTTARTDGKPPADRAIFERQLRAALKYLDYAPVIFLSALEGTRGEEKNMARMLRAVVQAAKERRKRVSTGQMNRFLERIDFQRAPVPMAKRIKILYMTQAAVAPPTFVLFTDREVKLHFAFERFLENQIRASFGFEGTPIWFKVRARKAGSRE